MVFQLEPEKYTVYYEYKTYFEEVYYDTGSSINGLKLKVKNTVNNDEIVVKNSSVNSSYTNSDGSGVSVLEFEIKRVGEYEISASFVDAKHEKVVLSIGETMGWDFINSIFFWRVCHINWQYAFECSYCHIWSKMGEKKKFRI